MIFVVSNHSEIIALKLSIRHSEQSEESSFYSLARLRERGNGED
jgi:hypothetical protein